VYRVLQNKLQWVHVGKHPLLSTQKEPQMNRPVTSAATLLLLAFSAFAYQAPAEPNPSESISQPATSKLPSTFTHPLGFSLRHPADWRIMQSNGTTALIPARAPDLDKNPTEFYALTALPEPANVEAHLKADIAQSLPGLQLESATTDRGTTTLRYRTAKTPDQPRVSAVIRGTTRDNLLIVMAALGLESAITKHDDIASEIFTTITAAPRSLDPAIRGRWSNSSSYSSTNFSMATSRTCTLNADGTYTYSSQTAGGTSDVSADSGATRTSGLWTAKDGTLTLTPEGGTPLIYKYRLVDNNLVTTQGNKRTIWSRN